MCRSVVGGNLLRMKLDFIFIRFNDVMLDISLKLGEGSDKLIKDQIGIPVGLRDLWM